MSDPKINLIELKAQMHSIINKANQVIELCDSDNPDMYEIRDVAGEGFDDLVKEAYYTTSGGRSVIQKFYAGTFKE